MGTGSLDDRVLRAVGDKRLLLVLDNFEQVVAGAPWLRHFLEACAGLKLLVSSRIRLRISGENDYQVAPLSIPTLSRADGDQPSGAVRLFVDRARAIRPDFDLNDESVAVVSEIVRRVDGLPLAIELAAARTRALSPAALLQRMERRLPLLSGGARDLPLRQQTMRDTIAWSYDLLTDEEKCLFRRLAVFVDGFDLDAAEAIGMDSSGGPSSAQLDVLDVVEGITSLVEHSLLRHGDSRSGEPRYQMLETVREFARERLAESQEQADVHRRHADYFLAFAEDGEPGLTGPVSVEWLARLDREKDNLRVAVEWAVTEASVDLASRLGAVLWRFWQSKGYLAEGRSLLEGVIGLEFEQPVSVSLSSAMLGAAMLTALQGNYDEAARQGARALSGWREVGDSRGIGHTLLCLAAIDRYQDRYPSAENLGRESLAAFVETDDSWGMGHALAHLGMVAWVQGDHESGKAYYEESLTNLRNVGDDAGLFQVILELGKGACDDGDLDLASARFGECMALCQKLGDEAGRGAVLTELGVVARLRGEYPIAAEFLLEATSLAQKFGDRRQEAYLAAHLGNVEIATGDFGTAAARFADALTLFRSMGNQVGIAQSLEEIARSAAARGNFDAAIRLFGSSAALFASIGAQPPPDRNPAKDAVDLQSRISAEEYATAWQAGSALSLGEAAEEALDLASQLARENVADAAPGDSSTLAARLGLTPREVQVLRLLVDGKSDREIADALSISERTAGNHVQHAMQKIGVESRTAAAVFAVRNSLD
jgi:predicted ATPase/DNA-binding CsgD family transcriptional regulator